MTTRTAPSATALYDIPGPVTRRRHRLYGFAATVLILALLGWIVYLLVDTGQFSRRQMDALRIQGHPGAAAARTG